MSLLPPIVWPKVIKVVDVAAAVDSLVVSMNGIEARLAALELDTNLNREALRAIFTILHPEADHPEPVPPTPEDALPPEHVDPMAHFMSKYRRIAWNEHEIIMDWLDKLGGELPL